MKAKFVQIWDKIMTCKDESGRVRSKLFVRLPSKKLYPDYYQVTATSIDRTNTSKNNTLLFSL